MALDITILVILILTIFLTMRRGFVLSVVSFFKGFVSLIIAWLFCDDAADWLINKTEVGIRTMERINQGLSSKWESSDIYMALPDLFKENGGSQLSDSLILDGSAKLAQILLAIICFVLIVAAIRLVLAIIGSLFSHKNNDGFAGKVDWLMGLVLGLVLGVLYVFVFLALLVPVAGLVAPEYCQTIVAWLDESMVAGDLYNNNLILILFRDLMV
ncbi:MAG: CvpA family protein [Firmicutes bacterium]|nr:CvpA family protein [Bacillota bacterium]